VTEWTAVSGSWRTSTQELKRDLRAAIAAELACGRGIVTGGALGVDFDATEQTLEVYRRGERTLVIIPAGLEAYNAHYASRAREGVITGEQHRSLIAQLRTVKALGRLVELGFGVVDRESYYARNTEVLRFASRLLALQVDGSPGTQDTIEKARAAGLEVRVRSYQSCSATELDGA
jgi:hypothetical protein